MKNTLNHSLRILISFFWINSKNTHIKLGTAHVNSKSEEISIETKEDYVLNKSLKHLEFISQLDINITDNQLRFFSLDFYHDLETAKLISQINTINTSRLIKNSAA